MPKPCNLKKNTPCAYVGGTAWHHARLLVFPWWSCFGGIPPSQAYMQKIPLVNSAQHRCLVTSCTPGSFRHCDRNSRRIRVQSYISHRELTRPWSSLPPCLSVLRPHAPVAICTHMFLRQACLVSMLAGFAQKVTHPPTIEMPKSQCYS